MIDPATDITEFEQRVRKTPDIAQLETEDQPENIEITADMYYRAFLSSDIASRMKQSEDPYEVIKPVTRRIFNLGANEITVDGSELLIAYKQ
jgi:hypothetical protein